MKRASYHILGGEEADEGVKSICGVVMGGPQPYRGVLAGLLEVTGAVCFPTILRVVVGCIGVARIFYGLRRGTDFTALPEVSQ